MKLVYYDMFIEMLLVDVRSLILQVLKKAADFQEHCCRLAAQELCEEYARKFFPKEDLPKWLVFVGYAWLRASPVAGASSDVVSMNRIITAGRSRFVKEREIIDSLL